MDAAAGHARSHLRDQTRGEPQRLEIAPEEPLQVSLDLRFTIALQLRNPAELVNLAVHVKDESVDPVVVLKVCIRLN